MVARDDVVVVVESSSGKGKGKVRARKKQLGTANTSATAADGERKKDVPSKSSPSSVLRLDMLPHSHLEGGEMSSDPPRRFPDEVLFDHVERIEDKKKKKNGQSKTNKINSNGYKHLERLLMYSDTVLRINWDTPAGAQEGMSIIRKGEVPVVLRRTPFLTSLVAKWDLDHLVSTYVFSLQ